MVSSVSWGETCLTASSYSRLGHARNNANFEQVSYKSIWAASVSSSSALWYQTYFSTLLMAWAAKLNNISFLKMCHIVKKPSLVQTERIRGLPVVRASTGRRKRWQMNKWSEDVSTLPERSTGARKVKMPGIRGQTRWDSSGKLPARSSASAEGQHGTESIGWRECPPTIKKTIKWEETNQKVHMRGSLYDVIP